MWTSHFVDLTSFRDRPRLSTTFHWVKVVAITTLPDMSLVSRDPFQLSRRYAEHNRWEKLNGPGGSRITGRQFVQNEGLVDQ